MSGNSTSKNEEICPTKNNKIFLIGYLNRINKENFRKEFKGDWVYFKCFPGAHTKQLDYYSIPMLVDEKPNTTITHLGFNDIIKSNYHTVNPNQLAKGIVNIGLKYNYYGVGQIALSSILARINNDLNKFIKHVNFSLRRLCKACGFAFIFNENIDRNRLWRDDIHLTNGGTSLLYKNILEHSNSFFHQNMDFSVTYVETKQVDNEKSHRKKMNESANFILEMMKIRSDKTREQYRISKPGTIRVKNVNNVIIDILIITQS